MFFLPIRGEGDGPDPSMGLFELLNFLDEPVAVLNGHPEVYQDHVGRNLLELPKTLAGRGRHRHECAEILQGRFHQVARVLVVIHDKNMDTRQKAELLLHRRHTAIACSVLPWFY